MDSDGYPDEAELTRISEWRDDRFDWSGLMAFIRPLWRYAEDGYWKQQGSLYRLVTGGWSGNESIIVALRANSLFWGTTFLAEVVGGLYWFEAEPASGAPRQPRDGLLHALHAARPGTRTAKQNTQNRIINEVVAEVARATGKFPGWPTDPLHALAILGEEFGELTQAMLQRVYEPHKATADDVRTEAVQTAAMALRLLFSLDRYKYKPCAQHAQEATEIRQEPVEAPGD
jgi:NTP pyrophosphatase (non-canonical NTP hydrolase)